MQVLNLATLEKQDEILRNFPIESGIDSYKYDRVSVYETLLASRSAWTTALEINGEGFFNHALIGFVNATTGAQIRITLDNEVILESSGGNVADRHMGLRYAGLDLFMANNNFSPSGYVNLVFAINKIGMPIIINPLLFKTMLRIEYKSTAAGAPTLNFIGGIKIG